MLNEKEKSIQNYKIQIDNQKKTIENLNQKLKKIESATSKEQDFNILDQETMKSLEKVKELGRGGNGTAYEVIKKELYVLKELYEIDHENLKKFMQEYELLRMLNHPNILKAYGIFLSNEKMPPSILLEHCMYDIGKAIKKKSLTNIKIVYSIYQIAEGMKYIHFRKIIHRDLKPSNILICNDGTIKICDFGISKYMENEQGTLSLTSNVGTLFFMSPEIVNNQKYTEKTDVYSFGVLIYFLLSGGKMPKISIGDYSQGKKANIPSDFTPFAKELINSCWNFDYQTRPSFQEICDQIKKNNYQLFLLSKSEALQIHKLIEDYQNKIPKY